MLSGVVLAWWGALLCAAAPPAQPLVPPIIMPQQPPQVLVSVKYGPRGGVDGLLVAQYRVPPPPAGDGALANGSTSWMPALSDQRRICADLCAAGLGGAACGQSCTDITPSRLLQLPAEKSEQEGTYGLISDGKNGGGKRKKNTTSSVKNLQDDPENKSQEPKQMRPAAHEYTNAPRVEVCPILCKNNLGWPLCECPASAPPIKMADARKARPAGKEANWWEVCSAFCPLSLSGCPACAPHSDDANAPHGGPLGYSLFSDAVRTMTSNPAWIEWCSYQCSRGDGGAACNCDRSPFF